MKISRNENTECAIFKFGIDQVIVYRVDVDVDLESEGTFINSIDMVREPEKESMMAGQILDLSKQKGDKTQYIGMGIPTRWLENRINRFQMSGISILKELILDPFFRDVKVKSIRVETPDYLMDYVDHVRNSIEAGCEPYMNTAGIVSMEIKSGEQEYIIHFAVTVDDIKISEITLNDMGDECGNMSSF